MVRVLSEITDLHLSLRAVWLNILKNDVSIITDDSYDKVSFSLSYLFEVEVSVCNKNYNPLLTVPHILNVLHLGGI